MEIAQYQGVLLKGRTVLEEILIRVLNSVLAGRLNVTAELTLTANVATTTLTDARLSAQSFIGLCPLTANAAAAVGTTYISARNEGSCVVTHANNAQTDRDFSVLIIG